MSDFGGEVMAEVLAERALVRPQIIPLVPLTNQYRHQDHMDLKDYKSKVRPTVTLGWIVCEKPFFSSVWAPFRRAGEL